MQSTGNLAKDRIAAGRVAFGLGVRFSRTVEIARMAKAAGYHYLFIDMEHSPLDLPTVAEICVTALDAGVTPTVRIPSQNFDLATRLLDSGAQGIVVPHVNTAHEARAAVEACMFPPYGTRSTGGAAIQLHWEAISPGETARRLNQMLLLSVLIETPEAIDNIDGIAAVDGVDVLSIGSNDLLMAMDMPGEFDHPDLLAAYEKVRSAAQKHGKTIRIGGTYEAARLKRTVDLGSRMVVLGNDSGLLMQSMRAKLIDTAADLDPHVLAD